jgi:hypothetical protein
MPTTTDNLDDVVSRLLFCGTNINHQTNDGCTALLVASQKLILLPTLSIKKMMERLHSYVPLKKIMLLRFDSRWIEEPSLTIKKKWKDCFGYIA